jgi:hypothetical protein
MGKRAVQLVYALTLDLTSNREECRDWDRRDTFGRNMEKTIFVANSNLRRSSRNQVGSSDVGTVTVEEDTAGVRINEGTNRAD